MEFHDNGGGGGGGGGNFWGVGYFFLGLLGGVFASVC